METLLNNAMTGQEKYDKIFDVLTTAYLNDTLQPGNPCGCAIGNLVAKAFNIRFYKNKWKKTLHWNSGQPKWPYKMVTFPKNRVVTGEENSSYVVRENEQFQQWYRTDLNPELNEMAESELFLIGLPVNELLDIEWHFENGAAKGASEDERMFLGLAAVLDYLAEEFQITERKNEQLKLVFQLS